MNPNDFQIYGTAILNAKGQIVIPNEARTRLNMNPGERLVIMDAGYGDGVTIVKSDAIEQQLKTWANEVRSATKDNPSKSTK